jgi:putative phosphoribosyl transferase
MFKDRVEAGVHLGEMLKAYAEFDPVVLGLARGGVIVAREVAKTLGADLDVLVARKIGAPNYPEFAVGAVAAGALYVDRQSVAALGISAETLRQIVEREERELERRERVYRAGRFPLNVRGRVVIVVDDGLATGATARAAVQSVRQHGAARVIFAAPVCAASSAHALGDEADAVVCLLTPPNFQAVGNHYRRFEQTTDAEVLACLNQRGSSAGRSNLAGRS